MKLKITRHEYQIEKKPVHKSQVMRRIIAATALSVLSSQAMSLNLVTNPGGVSTGTTFTVGAGQTLDTVTGKFFISGTFDNYGVSSESPIHIGGSGRLFNYGFLSWAGRNPWDQSDNGATIINHTTGTMLFGARASTFLDWHGGSFENQGLVRILGGRFIFEGGSFSNSGKFLVEGSASSSFIPGLSFRNSGYLEVSPQGTWCNGLSDSTGSGADTFSTGQLVVNGKFGARNLRIFGGTLSGVGTLDLSGDFAYIHGGGKLTPGATKNNGIGTFTVNTLPPLELSADLDIDISGASAHQYDLLKVNGQIILGGRLNVVLRYGYIPPVGSVYNIVHATTSTGSFDQLNLPQLPAGRTWSVDYTSTGVRLLVQ